MKVTPTFKGTRDVWGDDMRFRAHVIEKIREVFILFGFEPLETSVLERKETLFGKYGDEAENLLFTLSEPHDDGGLRYDHTVPLARFAATHWHDLPKPYKRFAIGPVFRAENPQAGRYRQFTQCDFDTLGSTAAAVDAEIVAINYTVFKKLGFGDQFVVQLNDRRLLNAMVREMGFSESADITRILRAWDKLDKNSAEEVFEYVVKQFANSNFKREELETKYAGITKKLLAHSEDTFEDMLTFLREIFVSKESAEALDRIEDLMSQIKSLGVPSQNVVFNPLLARGLTYYTGPIFEITVKEAGIGSLGGGGRFDNLIEQMGGPSVAASGSSFGIDRVLLVMEQLKLRPENSQTTKVFVTIFDANNEKLMSKTLHAAKLLRDSGIATEVYSGEPVRMGKQTELAVKKNIPYLLVLGPDEMAKDEVSLKNLATRETQQIPLGELSDVFKKL